MFNRCQLCEKIVVNFSKKSLSALRKNRCQKGCQLFSSKIRVKMAVKNPYFLGIMTIKGADIMAVAIGYALVLIGTLSMLLK